MRKSFDGLQALVRQHLRDDPLSGRWYVFINRRRTLCKVLCFEAGGFCIWAKRLEKGLLASLACGRSGERVLSRAEFHALVDGLEIRVTGRRLHGIDPYTWLVDILQQISVRPARDVAQLTPRLWKDRFADNPMTSDVSKAVPAKLPQAA